MIAGLIIAVITALFVIALGVIILLGKGSNLIAGYNTASEEEKAEYDEKKLNQITGITCILTGVLIIPPIWFHSLEVILGLTALIFIISIVCVILANTWARKK